MEKVLYFPQIKSNIQVKFKHESTFIQCISMAFYCEDLSF